MLQGLGARVEGEGELVDRTGDVGGTKGSGDVEPVEGGKDVPAHLAEEGARVSSTGAPGGVGAAHLPLKPPEGSGARMHRSLGGKLKGGGGGVYGRRHTSALEPQLAEGDKRARLALAHAPATGAEEGG